MLIQFILFFALLATLFFLSHKISTYIYTGVFLLTKNKSVAIGVLIVLLLPGTIIHELSHFLVATILRVPTGELTVIPSVEKGEVKAGKLFLGNTDPFRLSLIGLAPIIIGIILIYLTGIYFIPQTNELTKIFSSPLLLFVICFLLFVVSLTMFSSKKDTAGLRIAAPVVLLILISLYFVGVRIFLDKPLTDKLTAALSGINYYLSITVMIDFTVFLVLCGNLYFWEKVLKRAVN